jgi:F-box protein, helicase, 18
LKLTTEQIQIINSKGNIKINAVAGSGKTTTIIEYAKSRPTGSRILYLAFNKTVKLEAERRFLDIANVKVETAHSLAYKNIVYSHNYNIKPNGYSSPELVKILNIKHTGEKHSEYIMANHVLKLTMMFCNSDKQKVSELDYLSTAKDDKAQTFVKNHFAAIELYAREFLSKMNNGSIGILHDFYLKKFQLSNPVLPYDFILFDEGQDASPAMLDVFLKQKATKAIVGDEHQQIYGWRYAVNSLSKVDFESYYLGNSFRFNTDIANLAKHIIDRKSIIEDLKPFEINGLGQCKTIKTKAIIARSNLMLLLKAIEYVTEKKEIKHIYFEGNINSYTYADEGASLYDVLNLFNGKIHNIKDPLLKTMHGIGDLEEYIDQTDDAQLGMMLEIVTEYGNEIYDIIKLIKEKHVSDAERDKAQVVFSTVHRCKGMEYDNVQLLNDFITEEKLKNLSQNEEIDPAKLKEEVNLLYVAVTRAKHSLTIPEQLMPKDFPESKSIFILRQEKPDEKESKKEIGYSKSKSVSKLKIKTSDSNKNTSGSNTDAYSPWSTLQDKELRMMYFNGTTINDISKHFGRTKGAIASRIKKLKLEEQF